MPSIEGRLAARLQTLGSRVRQARLERGWSQEALAHAAGLHRTYIGPVEQGKRNLTVGSAFALADALDMEAADLLRKEP